MTAHKQLDKITLDLAPGNPERICYMILPMHPKEEQLAWMEECARRYDCSMAIIAGVSWDHDMTPWEAPDLGGSGRMLKGRAAAFLETFLTVLLPMAEEGLSVKQRSLVGISLSGLFALWAASRTGAFSRIATISGSFWYDNLTGWLSGTDIAPVERFYISLGDKERLSPDPRVATVEERTREVVRILREKGCPVTFEMNPGGHFASMYPRMEKALDELLGRKDCPEK